jgi:hypothetical protein
MPREARILAARHVRPHFSARLRPCIFTLDAL